MLALMAIVLTGGVMGFKKALARESLDAWTRTMSFDISAGRQAAQTARSTVTVTLGTSSYLVAVSGGSTLKYGALPSPITLTTTCAASICSFDRRGVPIVSGTITLTNASLGVSRVVTIQSGTGRVSYQ